MRTPKSFIESSTLLKKDSYASLRSPTRFEVLKRTPPAHRTSRAFPLTLFEQPASRIFINCLGETMMFITLLLLWSIVPAAFAQDAKLIEAAKKEGRLVLYGTMQTDIFE